MFVLRTFYSLKDTRTPMLANLVLTPIQIGLYVVLTTGIAGWSGLGLNGIPVADAVFYALLFASLALLLRRRIGGYDIRGVARTFTVMAIASTIGAVAAFGVARLLAPDTASFGAALLQVSAGGIVGLALAFGLGRLAGVPELSIVTDLLGRLIRRKTPRTPEEK
jgi:putative peptidoglycan lipid II flippase